MIRRLLAAVVAVLVLTSAQATQAQTATLLADRIEISPGGQLSAVGSVEVFLDGASLRAQSITFDQRDGRLLIEGPLVLRDSNLDAVFLADAAELDEGLRTGILRAVRLILSEQVQLAAETATRKDERFVELGNTVVSSCRICSADEQPLWQIRADKIVHDRDRGRLFFTNARLDLGGTPIVFLPRLSVPAPGTTRATGFLAPIIEPSSLVGTRISVPYFIMLGDTADVTLTPIFARDGTSVGFRGRKAFRSGLVELNGTLTSDATQNDALRGYLFSDGDFELGNNFLLNIHTEWATDIDYPIEYEITETPELTSQISISRTSARQDFSLRAVQVESLRDDEDPYRDRLPATLSEFDFRHILFPNALGGTLTFGADANARYRSSTRDVVGRDIARVGAELTWDRTDILGPGLVLSYGAFARADTYAITDDATYSAFPLVLNNGGFAELRWPLQRVRANGATDLVEPFLRYTDSTRRGPATPNGDSRVNELDFGNLLRNQQFAGREAVDTGRRLAAGATWRATRPNGYSWTAGLGRIAKETPSSQFSISEGLSGWASDWLVEADITSPFGLSLASTALLMPAGAPTRLDSELRYDQDNFGIGLSFARLIADPAQNRPDPVNYLKLASAFRLSQDWSGAIDYGYDLNLKRADVAAMRFRFENECLGVDLSLSHRLEPSASLLENLDLGFEVSLLGFGGESKAERRACISDGSFLQ